MQKEAIKESIQEWIKLNGQKATDLVSKLVQFNTVNEVTTGNEKDCQMYVAKILSEMGLKTDVFSPESVNGFHSHPAYFPGKDYSNRPNVVGIGKGKGGGKSLLFSSHIDTTAVASGWIRDPWTPELKNDRLYGLGTFDMKGGLAASILALQCLMDLGIALKGDVLIESVVDEEFGGANGTLASRVKGYDADAAIIPEPTNLVICPATRGGALWRVTFKGNTGMSFSGERIINPTQTAAKFIVYLEEFEKERSKKTGPDPFYKTKAELPAMITRLEAGDMKAELCDTGPEECHVDIWVECYPGVTEDEIKKEILDGFKEKWGSELVTGEYAPTFNKMIRFLPGAQIQKEFPLISVLQEETSRITNEKAEVSGAPFACDAFIFNLYSNTPAIVMGPKGANAHAPDEYIEVSSLYKLIEIYANIIIEWCGLYQEN